MPRTATGDDVGSILQRGVVNVHLENLNPFMPTVQLGMEVQNSMSTARQGSGAVGAQAEYDLHTRNNGFNTGRAGQWYLLIWDDRSLRASAFPDGSAVSTSAWAIIGEGDDGLEQLYRSQGLQCLP